MARLVVAILFLISVGTATGCNTEPPASDDGLAALVADLQAEVDSLSADVVDLQARLAAEEAESPEAALDALATDVADLQARLAAEEAEWPVTSIDGLVGGTVNGGISVGPLDNGVNEGGQIDLLGTPVYPWFAQIDRYQDQLRLMHKSEGDATATVLFFYDFDSDKFVFKRDVEVQGTLTEIP